jgi:two-component system cell cycle response regulator DivK
VGQKILVVEDNELNLKLFCDLLRAHAYEAEPVRDGREAVERARSVRPDLVIMDIQMPYISGLELIEQMKSDEELKRTPIMAVTAYAAKGDEERIRDAGAEGYVSKPISLMRFIEAVRGLLAAAEAMDAAQTVEQHPSLRGAEATKQSSDAAPEPAGLLRSARNDGEKAEASVEGLPVDAAPQEPGADTNLGARESATGEKETAPASPVEGDGSPAVEEAQARDEPEDGAPGGAGVT